MEVVIIIQGGVIQNVIADGEVHYRIIDHDINTFDDFYKATDKIKAEYNSTPWEIVKEELKKKLDDYGI
jgi:hypothetical protein